MMVVAVTLIAISLKVASDEGMMLHLVLSVLAASMLPVLLVCEFRSEDEGSSLYFSQWALSDLFRLAAPGIEDSPDLEAMQRSTPCAFLPYG